jgi:Na+:H+ antiporter, NhaA family
MNAKKPLSTFDIRNFINAETSGGVILIIATIIAMVWANSAYYHSYHYIWHEFKAAVVWGDRMMEHSLHAWINDGLMVLFFFTVGLEIKREIMGGELSSLKKAALPIGAAIGGMIVPACIYALITINYPEYRAGWGIPMATDIAFSLGLLAILGSKININIKIFLTALAIADDLGAIIVIAIFYTDTINYTELLYAAFFLGILVVANYSGVRKTIFYALVGLIGVWMSFMYSGIHATISGVLIALTIPARTKIDEDSYLKKLTAYVTKFQKIQRNNNTTLLTQEQSHLIANIEKLNEQAHTPLQQLEHFLHPLNLYFILPLFALSNAGVHIEGSVLEMVIHPISLAIIAGLVLGKVIGISLFSRLMVALKIAVLPTGVTWKQLYGVALLGGIGFTMSMFVADLAFIEDQYKQIAKVGIMAASLTSAIIGMIVLNRIIKNESPK